MNKSIHAFNYFLDLLNPDPGCGGLVTVPVKWLVPWHNVESFNILKLLLDINQIFKLVFKTFSVF